MKVTRYHILLALAGGPIHGAEIRRRVDDLSHGTVKLYPAMLYGTLDELSSAGWIAEADDVAPANDQARWRFYALTPEGRKAVDEETRRLEGLVTRARAAMGAAGG